MIEDEKKFDNKNYIEKHNKDVALSREMEQQKPEKTFMGYFEEDYQKVRKRIKLIKHTKCVFKLATIIACLISATLFLSALIDKNTARSELKKHKNTTTSSKKIRQKSIKNLKMKKFHHMNT